MVFDEKKGKKRLLRLSNKYHKKSNKTSIQQFKTIFNLKERFSNSSVMLTQKLPDNFSDSTSRFHFVLNFSFSLYSLSSLNHNSSFLFIKLTQKNLRSCISRKFKSIIKQKTLFISNKFIPGSLSQTFLIPRYSLLKFSLKVKLYHWRKWLFLINF